MNTPTPQYRVIFDHLETDVTGWVIAEIVPGLKFESYEEAKEQLKRIGGEDKSP